MQWAGQWTLRRAAGTGLMAGIASLVLWPVYVIAGEAVRLPFILILGVCCLCGASILAFTAVDLARRRRGSSIRPIRAFDLALGTLLLVPGAFEIQALMG